MQNLTQPTLLLKPFADSGDKNTLPVTNTDVSNPQRADLTNGFPQITSESPDNGGLPPERKDFNGLGYLTTSYDWFYQAGGTFTYNATIASAIGGYPKGARLWYTDASGISCILKSSVVNNSNNFLTDSSVIGISGSGKPWEIENFRGIALNTQYVSNCITEIPQDIKLELSSGALILKSGSVITFPDGTQIQTTSDISSQAAANRKSMILYRNGGLQRMEIDYCYSGSTAPTISSTFAIWYDTTNNVIKFTSDGGATWITNNISFPLCAVTETTSGFTSIDQVFNGFGYIGGCVFALPGVKGLIPNGRNIDGTLKNTNINNTALHIADYSSGGTGTRYLLMGSAGGIGSQFDLYPGSGGYDNISNYNIRGSGTISSGQCIVGVVKFTSGKIDSLDTKPVFHATDYYDLEQTNNNLNTLSSNVSTLDSQNVKLTGNQTIAGNKTFTSSIFEATTSAAYFGGVLNQSSAITKGTIPSANCGSIISLQDSTNISSSSGRIAALDLKYTQNKDCSAQIMAFEPVLNSTNSAAIRVVYPASGDAYTSAPIPVDTTSTSSTKIATTGWVNSTGNNVVHLNGTETITGNKTFSGAVSLNGTLSANSTVKRAVTGWSMPSDTYEDVALANGTYPAPANGYFQMSVNIQDRTGYAYCGVEATGLYSKQWGNEYTTDNFRFFIPVKKGDVVSYGLSRGTWDYARFIYAKGEA